MTSLRVIFIALVSVALASLFFFKLPQYYALGAIYAITQKISLPNQDILIRKQLGFSNGKIMMTATWGTSNTSNFYTLTGDISSHIGPYMEIQVNSFNSSDGLSDLTSIPGEHMRFGRQFLFTPGSKIHIKFLKSDHQGICFYYYEGRSVLCFYRDY